ncbi:MAG: VanW family protein [Actinobacteria bacterium]|nr:VanW family protein [Actinomycetota bacterium]
MRRWLPAAAVVLTLGGAVLGLAFAGSPDTLAEGVTIAGVDVGGLKASAAQAMLEQRADALSRVPVTFVAGSRRFHVTPRSLGVHVDFAAAVAAARLQGEGFGPVRGFRRLQTRVLGAELAPPTRVFGRALEYQLRRVAKAVDREPRNAAIRLRGLRPSVVDGVPGLTLERQAAESVVVRALAGLTRAPVGLPVEIETPRVTTAALAPALADTRLALSAPVRLALGQTRWRLPRWRIAGLLELPGDGRKVLAIGGPRSDRYFERLRKVVDRKPSDAAFEVSSSSVEIVPAAEGRSLDVEATSASVLAALTRPRSRLARVAVRTALPERTTAEARAMGIEGVVGSYTTEYGGDPNRIHNVRLVAELIDGALVAPGRTFSFNDTTGERTADKGFLEAPVIINGELQNGLGGGVCQVSTTAFNAAYEAGLQIDSRTNHALYISHYPLGRDATVNYPDLDLRFTNDTPHWLLLRTFVGASSLTVNVYGTETGRRVESEAAPLSEVAAAPIRRTPDSSLLVGQSVVDQTGQPSRSTSVRRRVYDASGGLLHDTTWSSYYRGEPTLVRVGSKPKPKPEPKPKTKGETGEDPGAVGPQGDAPLLQTPPPAAPLAPPADQPVPPPPAGL